MSNRIKHRITYFTALTLCGFSSALHSSEDFSIEEFQYTLEEKITAIKRDTGFETHFSNVSFPKSCVIELKKKVIKNRTGQFNITYTTVEVNQLDPQNVEEVEHGISLKTTNSKELVRFRSYSTEEGFSDNYKTCRSIIDKPRGNRKAYMDGESCVISYDFSYLTLPGLKEDSAHIAKAVRQLIEACGGKTS